MGAWGRPTSALASGSTLEWGLPCAWFPKFSGAGCPTAKAAAWSWKDTEEVSSGMTQHFGKTKEDEPVPALGRARCFAQPASPSDLLCLAPSRGAAGLRPSVGLPLP